ncbi:MAG TPA: UDP-N-acetylmuramate dehydrogenase [Bacteroidota bacterium]|nr:UDP-N-acetylmuramate dehydrogenase [Bacteroidota bacterium]
MHDAPHIREQVSLSDLTTIRLGGPARYVASCTSADECRSALAFARERFLPVMVLGGGSNVVFSDEGFPGLVLRVEIPGLHFDESGRTCRVTVGAGEVWDDVVTACVARGLGGIECLAGIPGTAGATPIQNVGAYGQEVRDTLQTVDALELTTGEERHFSGAECGFGYRWSRFKGEDAGRYVVTSVTFRLEQDAQPRIRYPELSRAVAQDGSGTLLPAGEPGLNQIRKTVLRLRRSKSMVIDPDDPSSRSVGSFFMNPILSPEEFEFVREQWRTSGQADAIPAYPSPEGIKIPAAWLVEHAGFPKGTRRGKIGISEKHALALINRGGTTRELLAFAGEIQAAVERTFGIRLAIEPVIVGANTAT